MTGDGDRLDQIERELRDGFIEPRTAAWLCRGLRDARAEIDAREDERIALTDAKRTAQRELDDARAELVAERAKVQRVSAWFAEYGDHIITRDSHAAFLAALAGGGEQV